ncbi:very-long-chain enoyl-CoA reductase isoform X1 [Acinonyx jubatus]|uniref:Very-long-chain enoyl-CoA reductase n=1 Tax=Acinonyx jubatus TaxID=32536 RepID=A0A6J1YNM7_ACIJB|nr:very-long-chain enoyl-CoA reductase isoform X1 [Acinonyx jubatus]
MICLWDSQNSWDFSKPREPCGPEPAEAWAALGLSRPPPEARPALHWARREVPPCLPPRVFLPPVLSRHCVHSKASVLGDPAPRGRPQEVEILDAKTREKLCFLDKVEPHATIAEIKNLFTKTHPQWYPARQSLRLDPKGKSLKDEDVLQKLPVGTTATLYFRDLGAQISWVTVFLTEYAGPLFIYLLFYFRVPFIYGHKYDFTSSRHTVVHLACICHSFHYIKRLLETLFVHRFSHGTMPLRNIFKNCTYYWGFAAWMAYYINHPLYTPPTYGAQQVKLALAIFVICQLGNFSIHMALRDLRPAGSKTRKIPYPTKNPFTWLFLLVSCPNYTYEVGSWIGFAIMTQCLPVALFSLVGFTQMTIWAKGKHRSYLKEFRDYPPLRMPIIPFLL